VSRVLLRSFVNVLFWVFSTSYLDEVEFERWLRSALRTLESAKRDLEFGDYNWACFKAHQVAGKALKALLWGVGRPRIGHSLVHLLQHIVEVLGVTPPDEVVYACTVLSKFYTPTRYPDVWSEGIPEDYYSRREAEEAIRLASEVIEWVRELWRRLSKKE